MLCEVHAVSERARGGHGCERRHKAPSSGPRAGPQLPVPTAILLLGESRDSRLPPTFTPRSAAHVTEREFVPCCWLPPTEMGHSRGGKSRDLLFLNSGRHETSHRPSIPHPRPPGWRCFGICSFLNTDLRPRVENLTPHLRGQDTVRTQDTKRGCSDFQETARGQRKQRCGC